VLCGRSAGALRALFGQHLKQCFFTAREDRELNQNGQPAIKKLAMLSAVIKSLGKIDLRLAFVEANILSVLTDWLAPLPRDKALPHIQVMFSYSSTT
jgi:transcription factor SPN1